MDSSINALDTTTSRTRTHVVVSVLSLIASLTLSVFLADPWDAWLASGAEDTTGLMSISQGDNAALRPLTPEDLDMVASVADTVAAELDLTTIRTSPHLSLGVGLNRADGAGAMTIVGIDPVFAPALGLNTMSNGVGYTVDGLDGPVDIDVPIVTQHPDGISSDRLESRTLELQASADPNEAARLLGYDPATTAFVATDTFRDFAAVMLQKDVPLSALFGEGLIPAIEAIWVQTDDAIHVNVLTKALVEAGYAVTEVPPLTTAGTPWPRWLGSIALGLGAVSAIYLVVSVRRVRRAAGTTHEV